MDLRNDALLAVLLVAEMMMLILIAGLVGCAENQYRKPCTINMDVTLEDASDIDATCRREMPGLRDDAGGALGLLSWIGGCADMKGKRIIVPDDAETVLHEMRHQWDKWCEK